MGVLPYTLLIVVSILFSNAAIDINNFKGSLVRTDQGEIVNDLYSSNFYFLFKLLLSDQLNLDHLGKEGMTLKMRDLFLMEVKRNLR